MLHFIISFLYYLLTFLIIFLFSCGTHTSHLNGKSGSIFITIRQEIRVNGYWINSEEIHNVSIEVMNDKFYSKQYTYEKEYLAFPQIPIGKYKIRGIIPGFPERNYKNVEVSIDSISLVTIVFSQGRQGTSWNWDRGIIPNNGLEPRGCIKGTVYAGIQDKTDAKIYVSVVDAGWWTNTDKDGNFCLKNILPGTYTMFAGGEDFKRHYVKDIRVGLDSVSFVRFGISAELIPEDPGTSIWDGKIEREECCIKIKK